MDNIVWFVCGVMLGGSAAFLMFCFVAAVKPREEDLKNDQSGEEGRN